MIRSMMEFRSQLDTEGQEVLRGDIGSGPEAELRLVLLGKTGSGKSSLGNSLLGLEAFTVARGMCSGTDRCQFALTSWRGIGLQVTDTPGVCDTHRSEVEVLREVGKSLVVASPGPHVILMVLRCDRRFTQEEYDAYLSLKGLFGADICQHMIVVFVGLDCLGATQEERDLRLHQEVASCPPLLRNVIEDARGRYIGVNNMAPQAEITERVDTLLQHIQNLVTEHGGKFYSSHLNDDINELVQSHVQRHMKDDNVTYDEALMTTKHDVVEEKTRPEFFSKLVDIVGNKILPVLKSVLGKVAATAASVYCSVM